MIERAREAYGWTGELHLSAGPRGALGQIWRVETAGRTFAWPAGLSGPPQPAGLSGPRW